MAKKVSSVLGIDIGSKQIKIAEVKMQGRDAAITALGFAPTPSGAADHTGVYDVEAIGAVIKELISSTGATVPHVVISVAGQASVLVRTVEVPRMKDDELKKHMEWEVARNIPFAETTVQSDFRAIEPEDAAAQNMDVVMAISPQSAIDTLAAIIKRSGKTPYAIDVEPLSIGRSLEQSYAADLHEKTVCVVEIGHKSTSINMYRKGYLLMPRQVPIGGENFTRAIADGLAMDFDAAEEMKMAKAAIPASALTTAQNPFGGSAYPTFEPYSAAPEPYAPIDPYAAPVDPMLAAPTYSEPVVDPYAAPADPYAAPVDPYAVSAEVPPAYADPYASSEPTGGFVPPADPTPVVSAANSNEDPQVTQIFNAFAPVLDEFISEVRRSVDYFRGKHGEVDEIMLAGGAAKLGALTDFVGAALGIECNLFDPMRGLNLAARKIEHGITEKNRADFTVAIGNGLHILF